MSAHLIRTIRYSAGTIECHCGWTTSVASDPKLPDIFEPLRDAWDNHRYSRGAPKINGNAKTGSGGWKKGMGK